MQTASSSPATELLRTAIWLVALACATGFGCQRIHFVLDGAPADGGTGNPVCAPGPCAAANVSSGSVCDGEARVRCLQSDRCPREVERIACELGCVAGSCVEPPPPASCLPPEGLPVVVKESSGTALEQVATVAVVPLPRGCTRDPTGFSLESPAGEEVPVQVEVLNRWWVGDRSVRHLKVVFLADVPALSDAVYTLKQRAAPAAPPSTPLVVAEMEGRILVSTGPLKLAVRTSGFNLLDEVWLDMDGDGTFAPGEQLVFSGDFGGGRLVGRSGMASEQQPARSRGELRVVIEEAGPVRAVLRISAPTLYRGHEDHLHGFAVRLSAYAGSPVVRIDYQLQNSALGTGLDAPVPPDKPDLRTGLSWPLYFEEAGLELAFRLGTPLRVATAFEGGAVLERDLAEPWSLRQTFHDAASFASASAREQGARSEGWIDLQGPVAGVGLVVRHVWQRWPKGVDVEPSGRAAIALFPSWSEQYVYDEGAGRHAFGGTGLYWLEDMQHSLDTVALVFHGPGLAPSQVRGVRAAVEQPPVVSLHLTWYQQTGVSFSLDGVVPLAAPTDIGPSRAPAYSEYSFANGDTYRFGWNGFGQGSVHAEVAGGWVPPGLSFVATGNPQSWFEEERFAMAELNLRTQWLPGYRFAEHFDRVLLGDSDWGSGTWRRFDGHGVLRTDGERLASMPRTCWDAPDDSWGWLYQLEAFYLQSANPWVRDLFESLGEYRKSSVLLLAPFPGVPSGSDGHRLGGALAAYRVLGDLELFNLVAHRILHDGPLRTASFGRPPNDSAGGLYFGLPAQRMPEYGNHASPEGPGLGFLSQAVISFLDEVRDSDAAAWGTGFQLVAGYSSFNTQWLRFGASVTPPATAASSQIGHLLVDSQAWYLRHAGLDPALTDLTTYLDSGLNGGTPPFYPQCLRAWGTLLDNGRTNCIAWPGRYLTFALSTPKADTQPPAAIGDLEALVEGSGVRLSWTTPADARRLLLVWSEKPIRWRATSEAEVSWWGAHATGLGDWTPVPEQRQSTVLDDLPKGASVYLAAVTLDEADNVSGLSNLVSIETPAASKPSLSLLAWSRAEGLVRFGIATSAPAAAPRVVGCVWDFGDGGSSRACRPWHRYVRSGEYAVHVTVSDEASNTYEAARTVAVP